ncbi:50S ribosomal protein L3 N(5)-glutamine methyltransferase [Acidiferrobacter sp.]|uniref:50S ribosomal protein L3 N(5)-glutamine methyltransferase n=1 Tax=Acidiferrobacter sp. TaxID=1872107 RepID=UPI00261D022D|nr:50S ribosomal protein L3 N(5)-glutamine methyltransferase [Acidiferrobacter sp.]
MPYGAPRTVRDHVLFVERRLKAAHVALGHGTGDVRDEAAWLVSGAMGIAPGALTRHLASVPGRAITARIRALLASRIRTRQPLAYLLGEAWFAGRRYIVDPRVIVPRSLIGEFLPEGGGSPLADPDITSILDLCTGSGAIAIAAARAFPKAQVDAVDISEDALKVAVRNVRLHGMSGRVHPIASDLFSRLEGRRYDLIVSNPPYVSEAEMAELPREYRHEPTLALAGGTDGLDLVVPLLRRAREHLTADGRLVLEVGASRAALEARFPDQAFLWLASLADECVGYWHRQDLEDWAGD